MGLFSISSLITALTGFINSQKCRYENAHCGYNDNSSRLLGILLAAAKIVKPASSRSEIFPRAFNYFNGESGTVVSLLI